MKTCPVCHGDYEEIWKQDGIGCIACGNTGFDLSAPVPTCRICGKKDGSCEWDGTGYSHFRCREPKPEGGV